MSNKRSRTLTLLIAFAVGSLSIFLTDTSARLGYGVTRGMQRGWLYFQQCYLFGGEKPISREKRC